jgi:uncharacterized protein with HEPN domain
MKKRDYTDYLNDMITSIEETEEFTKGMSFEEFSQDKKTVNAVIRSLEVLGESTRKIPDDIRNKVPGVPWEKITGMRNKLAHEYFGVDLGIVWTVIKEELPPLKPNLVQLFKEVRKTFS